MRRVCQTRAKNRVRQKRGRKRESERENRGIRLVRVTSSCHGYMIHKEFGTTAALLSDKKGAERADATRTKCPKTVNVQMSLLPLIRDDGIKRFRKRISSVLRNSESRSLPLPGIQGRRGQTVLFHSFLLCHPFSRDILEETFLAFHHWADHWQWNV